MDSKSQKFSSHQLLVLLFQTRDLMLNLKRKELRKFGLTFEEATILLYIKRLKDKTTPVELSRQLLRKHHSVTGLLLRMEKKGLIVRNKDLMRKNMIRVSMTEKGEELYKKVYKEDSLEKMVDSLTEEQRQSLWEHLNILRDKSLEGLKIKEKPPLPD